jgi:hypothetical protein
MRERRAKAKILKQQQSTPDNSTITINNNNI